MVLYGSFLSKCQDKNVRKVIKEVVKQFENHRHEVFLKVSNRNERINIMPVSNEKGKLVGYFERFEKNFTKN
jgi:hypothetical protein